VEQLEEAKRPITMLAGPYGHPLHPALVPVPIGAWVASFVFDVASRLVDNPAFLTQGSRWLIGIGVLGALAAASIGALDLLAIPTGTRAFRTALVHTALNVGVVVAYTVNFLMRGTQTPRVGWGPLVLSAVSLLVLGVSGFLGGKLAFRFGVRVAAESTQAEGYRREP
jgi:uncharacterized membrane protein